MIGGLLTTPHFQPWGQTALVRRGPWKPLAGLQASVSQPSHHSLTCFLSLPLLSLGFQHLWIHHAPINAEIRLPLYFTAEFDSLVSVIYPIFKNRKVTFTPFIKQMDINLIKCTKLMIFSLLHRIGRTLIMNPTHSRSNVTGVVPAPLNSGQQLEPERLHVFPSYTKSSGDLFSLWGEEKETD